MAPPLAWLPPLCTYPHAEVFEVEQLGAAGFVLRARCDTAGVPFSSNFANHVQWVVAGEGPNAARLAVSADCRFHTAVWGPLKAQISRESLKVGGWVLWPRCPAAAAAAASSWTFFAAGVPVALGSALCVLPRLPC